MIYNQQQQDAIFSSITIPLGDEITWKWDERQSALLAEFSWEKKERILTILRRLFSEEWQRNNIKKAPKAIKDELATLANLSKEQLLFARPATAETPALALVWWPWGHGATYSMRIKILHCNYDDADLIKGQESLITKMLQRLTSG